MRHLYDIPLSSLIQVTYTKGDDVHTETITYPKALEVANKDNNNQLGPDVEVSMTFDGEELIATFTHTVITGLCYIL